METIDAVKDLGCSGKTSETIANEALRFLADRPETMRRFLGELGIEAGQVRGFAKLPSFRVAVLDFIVADPQSYTAFRWSSRLQHLEIGVAKYRFDGSYGWY